MSPERDDPVLDSGNPSVFDAVTTSVGPEGRLPVTEVNLPTMASGDLFGWTQNVAMGANPASLDQPEFLILSTMGGMRGPDGTPIALGYHTGHWELGLLVEEAATEFSALGGTPFAAAVTDPCDGRSNGTAGMLDSLAYRNDAAMVLRRLIRSLPGRKGVLGVATCDKGLPAMLMAVAGTPDVAGVIVPGGVMLLAKDAEDTARVQTLSVRFARGEISLDHAATEGCRACGSAGGGCQFMGTAATAQAVAEALGLSLPHSALSPSGSSVWRDMARRSSRALWNLSEAGTTTRDILTDRSVANAMAVHAAIGGSTNFVLHLPAIAHSAGLRRPNAEDWSAVSRTVPRLVDALPNGPRNFATVQVFMAGGIAEVMLRLAERGMLDTDVATVSGGTLADNLTWWERSERRSRFRRRLVDLDGIDPDDVILTSGGHRGTMCVMSGNLAPEGALVKSTAIDPALLDDGIYDLTGSVRVFTSEQQAIDAIKLRTILPGEVMVLVGLGPFSGMPETYQVTAALKYAAGAGRIPLLTDGRFSGVSTGPCVGHVSPEAFAGGPLGRLRDGDHVRVLIDTSSLVGAIDFLGDFDELMARPPIEIPRDHVPPDVRLWSALQAVSGGAWAGCVYDVGSIEAGLARS